MAVAAEQRTTIRQHINGVSFLAGAILLAGAAFGLLLIAPLKLIFEGYAHWMRGEFSPFLLKNDILIGASALAWVIAIGASMLMSRSDRLNRDFDKSMRLTLKGSADGLDRESATARDVAQRLLDETARTLPDHTLSDVVDEDYGAGFWANSGADAYWVAVSAASDDVEKPRGRFVISVAFDPGLSLIRRLRQRPDRQRFSQLFRAVSAAAKGLNAPR